VDKNIVTNIEKNYSEYNRRMFEIFPFIKTIFKSENIREKAVRTKTSP